jgi:hypothetical protein
MPVKDTFGVSVAVDMTRELLKQWRSKVRKKRWETIEGKKVKHKVRQRSQDPSEFFFLIISI